MSTARHIPLETHHASQVTSHWPGDLLHYFETREMEIRRFVAIVRGHVWDADVHGAWAFTQRTQRQANPHIAGHVNHGEWERSWDWEQATAIGWASR